MTALELLAGDLRCLLIEASEARTVEHVEMDFDVFFGVPKHRAPSVVIESGLTEDGWVTVNPRTLEAKFANVYAWEQLYYVVLLGLFALIGWGQAGLGESACRDRSLRCCSATSRC